MNPWSTARSSISSPQDLINDSQAAQHAAALTKKGSQEVKNRWSTARNSISYHHKI
jgi:hypothetical protein